MNEVNYVDIFTTPKITKALKVTFQYSFMTVPLKLAVALFIAYILNFKIEGVNFFRTAYYIPSILGGSVAIAVLWKAIFKDDGLLNTFYQAWLGGFQSVSAVNSTYFISHGYLFCIYADSVYEKYS